MSSIENTSVVRCPECGFKKPAGAASCPVCLTQQSDRLPAVLDWDQAIAGQLVGTQQDNALRAPPILQTIELPTAPTANRPAPLARPATLTAARPQPQEAARPIQNVAPPEGAEIVGRVIAIDNSQREPPDLDICRALTKLLWVVLLLALPLAAFGNTLVTFGPMFAVAGVAGVMFLLRFIPLTNLLWFGYLAHTNRRPDEQVPVWYARVRDTQDESEVMVRLKGLFSRGNVAPDDLVSFWGTWRDGVLMASRGFNQRTQTAIEFRQSKWWIWLLLTLVLVTAVAFHLHNTWISLNTMAG